MSLSIRNAPTAATRMSMFPANSRAVVVTGETGVLVSVPTYAAVVVLVPATRQNTSSCFPNPYHATVRGGAVDDDPVCADASLAEITPPICDRPRSETAWPATPDVEIESWWR